MKHQGNQEMAAANAFTKQAVVFDTVYSGDEIIRYKRNRVRRHFMSLLPASAGILELNSGTGEDAIYLARHGHRVHATDISEGMQAVLRSKVSKEALTSWVTSERCSFTELQTLANRGPYDGIFSNFAGLNCTGDLDKVLRSFSSLVKPGGIVTMVILPKFCLWETMMIFRGKFRTAFRRFFATKGRKARVESETFTCWYYNPGFVRRHLKDDFDLVQLEGLCTFVPPSYIERFAEKHTRLFERLKNLEERYGHLRPWRSIGDYYIISFRKK
jgi:ubiquinone/menaquinone biosynthesis C-methylase UbiE